MHWSKSLLQMVRPACPLYIHAMGPRSILSFSPNQQAVAVGSWSPAEAKDMAKAFATEPDKFEPVQLVGRPDSFLENKQFMPVVHRHLKSNIHKCPIFSSMAAAEDKSQFYHIFDLRNPPTIGRIPAVEDILGTVQVEQGQIVPETYQANSMYRPVSTYGAIMLSKEMARGIRALVESGRA